MRTMKMIMVFLFLITLFGCNSNLNNEKIESSQAERFITDKGYLITSNEGIVSEYILEKELLTEMPYLQYWSVQSVDPITYIGKRITTSKFIVTNHPLDNESKSKQTMIFLMEADHKVIGGYSFPNYNDDVLSTGWVNTIDGETLEKFTELSYMEWSNEWDLKYK